MIAYTRAYNLQKARHWAEKRSDACAELWDYDHVAWLGFVPTAPSPIRDLPHSLVIEMDDVAEEQPPSLDGTRIIFPTLKIADAIVSWVSLFARSRDAWAIAVHCTGGMSRSPAVTRWIWETYLQETMPDWKFEGLHAHTIPNPVLLRLLRRAAAEKERNAR